MSEILSDTDERTQAEEAYRHARTQLLSERDRDGVWRGYLSASALSTATAVSALAVVDREVHAGLIRAGVRWLEETQNSDGGWGDTPDSPSNPSTTLLVDAALALSATGRPPVGRDCWRGADDYLAGTVGRTARQRIRGLREIYGADRTFAAPILANLALASERHPSWWNGDQMVRWRDVPALPFELACLPQGLFRLLRLHVVSYALPALIAIGQVIHDRAPTRNPFLRFARLLARRPSLRRLQAIMPSSGGFLEAVPLTSFVTMSLAGIGRRDHRVVREGVRFLCDRARPDGSWPIDTDLSTWVTTQSVHALSAGAHPLPEGVQNLFHPLMVRQNTEVHPYTGAAPGGWAWTDLPGGVPDADDTAGALLALKAMGTNAASQSVLSGVEWLLKLQNTDGGWPTFCRGWGKLPFDRSAPDLTAHALRALNAWHDSSARMDMALERGEDYLDRAQRDDGSWVPLWFGNQQHPDRLNPVYGTARVLAAYRDLGLADSEPARRGAAYLVHAQDCSGGWGGDAGLAPSVEETALAVEALASSGDEAGREACRRGVLWLADRVKDGSYTSPKPIGLYFALLWYSEKLYPVIWTTAALGSVLPEGG